MLKSSFDKTGKNKERKLPFFPQVYQNPEVAVHSLPLVVVQAPTALHSPCSPMLPSPCNNTCNNTVASINIKHTQFNKTLVFIMYLPDTLSNKQRCGYTSFSLHRPSICELDNEGLF